MSSSRHRFPWLLLVTLTGFAAATPAHAGPMSYHHEGTFVLGGGFNVPVGGSDQYFNSSGSFVMAGGLNLSPKFALQAEWNHHWLAIDPIVLQHAASDSVSFDNAYASLWSMTINGIYRFGPDNEFVPYLTGGFGFYKRNIQLTQYAYVYYPPIWDPWWGWIDGGWVPGEAITGQREDSGLGFNVGGGIDFSIDAGASLFLEARYHQVNLDGVDMQIVPIQFGVRW